MIYVNRNAGLVPQELLDKAIQAQRELEVLPSKERVEFIKSKSHVWRAFKVCLANMSYGKCWYSESPEVQSFLDVDHFRPKLETRRSDGQCDPGYEWLAFSWDNFRLSAQRSNRPNTNEDTNEAEGKGSWFPLLEGSPAACWENRCEANEKPILLDPTVRRDVDLIDVSAEGYMSSSAICVGSALARVERSIKLYGLNLPRLVDARKRVMREVVDLHTTLMDIVTAGKMHVSVGDSLPVDRLVDQIRRATYPSSAYSKAARAQLQLLPSGQALCAYPEDGRGIPASAP
jgi:hypothetical protein